MKTGMASSFLLNSNKTVVIVLQPKNLGKMVTNQILTIDGITSASRNTVWNLGLCFLAGYVFQCAY